MNKQIILLSILSFILGACRVEVPLPKNTDANQNIAENPTAKTVEQETSNADVLTTAVKCPSQNFEIFLMSFIDSLDVQKSFTATPLESVTIDALAEPEPVEVKKMLAVNETNFPLMPSSDQQAKDGLISLISNSDKKNVEVTLHKPDTDYQMSFFFRQEGCWTLYRIKDYSL
ncbi:MAG: hypothetical protein ACREO1_02840 [Arenimonas sp.]